MGLIADRLESSGALEVISSSIPGIKDALVLGQLRSWVDAERWDRIVVDGPASGRAREMLRAPKLLSDAATDGPVASQGERAHELLVDTDRSAVLLVTLPEETPVNETIETAFAVEDDPGMALAGVVINRVFPNVEPPKRRAHPAYPALLDRWNMLVTSRSRLDDELPIPRMEIVELPAGVNSKADVLALIGSPLPCSSTVADDDVEPSSYPQASIESLMDNDVVVTVGTGGVGKTSVGAALAVHAATMGRRVALITIDPAKRLADALGLDHLDDDLRPIELGGRGRNGGGSMSATMLDPQKTFARVVRANAPTPEQATVVLESPLSSQLAESLSGMTEYMAVERLWELTRHDDFDLVVVDTPPSSDALAFLDSPDLLARLLDNRIYKLLVHGRKGVVNRALGKFVNQLISIVGGAVVRDAVAFFKGFDGMEEGFRSRGQDVFDLLRSDRAGFAVVVSPAERSVRSAALFVEQLRDESIEPALTIVNRCTPDVGKKTGNETFDAMLDHLRVRRIAEQRSIAGQSRLIGAGGVAQAIPTRTLTELGAGITSLDDVRELAASLVDSV